MYSLQTSLIILCMVVTGTARSVGVKVFYQLGCHNPLFVALLYLFGQSMSLLVYGVAKYCNCLSQNEPEIEYAPIDNHDGDHHNNKVLELEMEEDHSCNSLTEEESSDELSQLESQSQSQSQLQPQPQLPVLHHSHSEPIHIELQSLKPSLHHSESLPVPSSTLRPPLLRQGSKTGLTQESHHAVAWVHSIPYYCKPIIPGLINLANSAFKWASFAFVAASIAEMLSSGLELVLSVLVARTVRKRQISTMRWAGVWVVAIGLTTVHAADLWDTNKVDDGGVSSREHWIGGLLIIGQCVTAAAQDMAEELFLQEADFPATLLLGMEGVVGLVFGIPLYLKFSPESPAETLAFLQESNWKLVYVTILTVVFTVTGIFNIMTTGVTSSMTRNMWKNCRTLMVWITGLVIFYSLGNESLGEEWVVPDSFFVLAGFLIMLSGIYVYYVNK